MEAVLVSHHAQGLTAGVIDEPAPPGTPYPKPLPHTVRGWPGLGAATANSSP
jgi:hypothetical protein